MDGWICVVNYQMTNVRTESNTMRVVALIFLVTDKPKKLKKAIDTTLPNVANNITGLSPNLLLVGGDIHTDIHRH
jgi:imidazoleglycerol phosphate synthase glutamine amidotransferase subunit HisH